MSQVDIFIIDFLSGAAYDGVWTLCVGAVPHRRAAMAAHLAVVLYALTLFTMVLIVEKCILALMAYGLGNWIGTYLAVKRSK